MIEERNERPIKSIRLFSYPIRLKAPIRAAYGEVLEREILIIEVEDTEGKICYGEAANIYRETLESCQQVTEDIERGLSKLQALPSLKRIES